MILFHSMLLLTMATPTMPAVGDDVPGTRFRTAKSLSSLEQCLTERLSEYGEVTAIAIDGTKTLMLRKETGRPMLVDLTPPFVTVTTRFATGTRGIVERCL